MNVYSYQSEDDLEGGTMVRNDEGTMKGSQAGKQKVLFNSRPQKSKHVITGYLLSMLLQRDKIFMSYVLTALFRDFKII